MRRKPKFYRVVQGTEVKLVSLNARWAHARARELALADGRDALVLVTVARWKRVAKRSAR